MNTAFGKPGLLPNWSSARKQGVGTACSKQSKVWLTIASGIVTKVYYHNCSADLLQTGTTLVFTFRYSDDRWEGKEYEIDVMDGDEGLR